MREITPDDLASAQGVWVWDLGNQVLYDLCRSHFTHSSDGEIVAKVWLIGRSYAASIERRRNKKDGAGDFYAGTVAPAVRRSDIDRWLAEVSRPGAPGAPETIITHKRLMDLFKSLTDLDKRSLASKYLHFHVPDRFFIYDSLARRAITKLVPRLNRIPNIPAAEHDQEYKDFVRRCVWLRQHISDRHDVSLTPRQIDKLLLATAGET
ncbi:MAG: hypothetical protein ABSG86_10825 [Thermoguttaceae bacterium]|jgi:hypothetical protein